MIKIKFRKARVNGIPVNQVTMSKVVKVRKLSFYLENGWVVVETDKFNDATINSILSVIDPNGESDWLVEQGDNKLIVNSEGVLVYKNKEEL